MKVKLKMFMKDVSNNEIFDFPNYSTELKNYYN